MNGIGSIDRHLEGTGLVIGARSQLNAFSLGSNVRFVDVCDMATLRAANPAWRSRPLAPVEVLDPIGTLADVADCSVDFVIDWAMIHDAEHAVQRLDAMARVMRLGGALVLPACDSRFAETDADAQRTVAGLDRLAAWLGLAAGNTPELKGRERWPFARFVAVIGAWSINHLPQFELDYVQRYGRYNLAVFQRHDDAPFEDRDAMAAGAEFTAKTDMP